MTACHEIQDELADALFGTIDHERRSKLESHLDSCSTCAAELSSMRATLDVMSRRELPDPGEAFWRDFPDRIADSIASVQRRPDPGDRPVRAWPARRRTRPRGFRIPAWAGRTAAAAALLAVGVALGRLSIETELADRLDPDRGPAPPVEAAAAALDRQIETYINRCRALLVGIVNLDPAADGFDAFNLRPHQDLSWELAAQASHLYSDLDRADERRLARLVLELQEILLQIATLEAPDTAEGLRIVREGVDRRALLFKMNLESIRSAPRPEEIEAPSPG